MQPMTLQQAFDLAIRHHMAGQFQQAEQLYRQILSANPDHADSLHFLGLLAHQIGRSADGIELIRKAIALGLDTPDVHGNLGNALLAAGQTDQAILALQRSMQLNPNLVATHINLGNALQAAGKIDQAVNCFQNAVAINPHVPEAFNNLANAFTEARRFDEAVNAAERAIALNPRFIDALINLGNAHRFAGRFDPAIAAYRNAIGLAPAIAPNPDLARVQSNLGSALKDLGQNEGALSAYREAARLNPADPKHWNNVLLLLQYHPGYTAARIAAENREWDRRFSQPQRYVHASRKTEDRIRVGYLSPDFKDHAVGRNILPLFRNHDRKQFEIHCYSNSTATDAMTEEFGSCSDSFVSIAHLSDQQAADKIHADQIDILIDLALHTSGNRLLVMARKPAPIQAAFAGYPASTGLAAIDYRISDPYLDPPGMDESVYSEKTIRLPHSFWCFDPLDCADIQVSPLPALENGYINFGCLNNFCKVNDQVLDLWAQVMLKVDNSKLLLLTTAGGQLQRAVDHLKGHGIAPDRIESVPSGPRRGYFAAYHRIDIGLDTFPYNGHTTSLDSFWMGVPVVTLVGNRSVARAGWCQLSNLNLTELAARSPEQFVHIAVELSRDTERLSNLRSTLRNRMEQSPLMDAKGFAANIESIYRQMWETWGTSRGPSGRR